MIRQNMVRFDRDVCSDLNRANKLEWLETNGLGGFSSSTVTGLNTRRYHGLLTAATQPPGGRFVLLAKMEETLLIDGRHYDLSANQYPGAVYPQGYRYLKEFRLDPFPIFTYQVEDIEIEKRIFMIYKENATVMQYRILSMNGVEECTLELRPLIAFRDYHATTHHNEALNRAVHSDHGIASVTPYAGLSTVYFAHDGRLSEDAGNWYFNLEYPVEQERGLDAHEDLYNPFLLYFSLRGGQTATVVASTQPHDAADVPALERSEIKRRSNLIKKAPSANPFVSELTAAADQFLVYSNSSERGALNTVIAGYHWFADWGRDTMISLPGLTLMTGRPEIARNILVRSVASVDQGMLPNRSPEASPESENGTVPDHINYNTVDYNTADATLWLFEAVRAYAHYTGDDQFVREHFYSRLREIVNWHMAGTRYGIHADKDGLLYCGEHDFGQSNVQLTPSVQLTWMDAKIGDWVVTPRTGKPVEIQALWYNALCTLQAFAEAFDDAETAKFLREYAAMIRSSFNAQFWNADAGCLFDVIDGENRDASIRPNQIFAISLHHSMLPEEKEIQIVDVVQRELLTPLGLRTLSPSDPNYYAHYQGGVLERDSAYHQGTVWPWLMGAFISAYVKVHHRTPEARQQAELWLKPFGEHMKTAGLGQISEITDAEAPFEPRGCIAQAWSVAELLRAAIEDVYEVPLSIDTKHPERRVGARDAVEDRLKQSPAIRVSVSMKS